MHTKVTHRDQLERQLREKLSEIEQLKERMQAENVCLRVEF